MASQERYIKSSIYSKLSTDATLVTLLGGTSNIFGSSPPKEVVYPCIVYEIVAVSDDPNSQDTTGKMIETVFYINILSSNSKSEESDNIADRVKTLLHGQRTLNTSSLICYSCYRQGRLRQSRDPDTQILMTVESYRSLTAPK